MKNELAYFLPKYKLQIPHDSPMAAAFNEHIVKAELKRLQEIMQGGEHGTSNADDLRTNMANYSEGDTLMVKKYSQNGRGKHRSLYQMLGDVQFSECSDKLYVQYIIKLAFGLSDRGFMRLFKRGGAGLPLRIKRAIQFVSRVLSELLNDEAELVHDDTHYHFIRRSIYVVPNNIKEGYTEVMDSINFNYSRDFINFVMAVLRGDVKMDTKLEDIYDEVIDTEHSTELVTIEAHSEASRTSLHAHMASNSTSGARNDLWDNLNRDIHYRKIGDIIAFSRVEGTDGREEFLTEEEQIEFIEKLRH